MPGCIAFSKKVRDFLRTRFWNCAPSNSPLASPSPSDSRHGATPVVPPTTAFAPQVVSVPTVSDAFAPISDATSEGTSAVPVVVDRDIPAKSTSELRTHSLVHEVPRTLSPSPHSEGSLVCLPVLLPTGSDTLPPEQEVRKDSPLDYSLADSDLDSELLSLVHWPASTKNRALAGPALLRPVHCYIPVDVTNNIIASFDSFNLLERITLCSCALVCTDWLPASRRGLFHYVHFKFWDSPARYDLFVSRVLRSEHMRPWLARVRELYFAGNSLTRDNDNTRRMKERGNRLVQDFSGRFPNLLYLKLLGVDWSECPGHPYVYLTFFKQLHCLQELRLYHCCFPSFYAFWSAVAVLPSLRDLTLESVSWPFVTARPPVSRRLGNWPRLHAFTFRYLKEAHVHTLLSCLSESQAPSPSIRSLVCDAVYLVKNPEFVQSIGASVTEIFLSSPDYDAFDILAEDALSPCSELESLLLRGVLSSQWGKLAVMRQNFPSPFPLRQLTILVRMEGISKMEAEENAEIRGADGLELLDAVLDRDNFANLELVHFYILVDIARDTDEKLTKAMIVEVWKEKLAKLHARGIMKLKDIHLRVSPYA